MVCLDLNAGFANETGQQQGLHGSHTVDTGDRVPGSVGFNVSCWLQMDSKVSEMGGHEKILEVCSSEAEAHSSQGWWWLPEHRLKDIPRRSWVVCHEWHLPEGRTGMKKVRML